MFVINRRYNYRRRKKNGDPAVEGGGVTLCERFEWPAAASEEGRAVWPLIISRRPPHVPTSTERGGDLDGGGGGARVGGVWGELTSP